MKRLGRQAARVKRRLVRPALRFWSRRRTRSVTHLLAAAPRTDAAAELADVSLGRDLQILMSYRAADDDRLRMLSTVAGTFGPQIAGSGATLRVLDASPAGVAEATQALWRASALDVDFRRASLPLVEAYDALLTTATSRWFALQFDDQLSAGLTPDLLKASVSLLKTHAGRLGVVCPLWPIEKLIDDDKREIELVSHEMRSKGGHREYRFYTGGWRRPVLEQRVGEHTFGIFENFSYGFFFNHLIAPVDDYLRRLRWYAHHVTPPTAHNIELEAAAQLLGPFWTHIGVCLDGFSVLDLDYAHTASAVRLETPENRDMLRRVAEGYRLVARPREV